MHPNDTREIPLSQGMFATIDAEDEGVVTGYSWYAHRSKLSNYARTGVKEGGGMRRIYMHRLIMSPPDNMQVDHINGNGLDNRRSNLRIVTASQNQWNRANATGRGASGYIGVTLARGKKPWNAYIKHKGKRIHLGLFATAEEAARARDEKAIELRGDLAILNFPRT